jgi:hypothetical protein
MNNKNKEKLAFSFFVFSIVFGLILAIFISFKMFSMHTKYEESAIQETYLVP